MSVTKLLSLMTSLLLWYKDVCYHVVRHEDRCYYDEEPGTLLPVSNCYEHNVMGYQPTQAQNNPHPLINWL